MLGQHFTDELAHRLQATTSLLKQAAVQCRLAERRICLLAKQQHQALGSSNITTFRKFHASRGTTLRVRILPERCITFSSIACMTATRRLQALSKSGGESG